MAWSYSDYVTLEPGTAARLTRVRLFKQELIDALQNGKYKLGDHEHDPAVIGNLLAQVESDLASEEASAAESAGSTAWMVRARARRRC